MTRQQNVVVFKFLVLLFVVTFISGSFANMLCIPRYVPDSATTHVAARRMFGSNCHRANFIQLFDRSTIDDSAMAETLFTPKTIDLIPSWSFLPAAEAGPVSPQSQTLYSYQYVYLSYCSFRI